MIRSASVEFFLGARALVRSLEDTFHFGLSSSIGTSDAALPPPRPSPASGRGGTVCSLDRLRLRKTVSVPKTVHSLSRLRGRVSVGALAAKTDSQSASVSTTLTSSTLPPASGRRAA